MLLGLPCTLNIKELFLTDKAEWTRGKKQKLQKQVPIEQGSHQPDGMMIDRQNGIISEKLIRIKAYTGNNEIQITLGSKIKLMFLE